MNHFESLENMSPQVRFNPDGKEHSNAAAYCVDRIGHFLTTPATLFLRGAVRVFVLDFKPGFWGQPKNAVAEGFLRGALFVGLLCLAPFAILGATLGAPLRASTCFAKRDFIFHKQPQKQDAQKVNSVSIASFNALLMPEFISARNLQRPVSERVHEMAEDLIQKNFDIVCLQEAFHAGGSEKLDQAFHKAGYHVIRNVGQKVFGLSSGLFLASKYELENVQFFAHPVKGGVENQANKGVLIATALVGDKRIVIANTHLNGGGDDENPGYFCRQIQQIAVTAHLNKYLKEAEFRGETIDGCMLCSDTNVAPTYYAGRNPATGKLRPVAEPEWLLADRLYEKMLAGDSLSIPEQVNDPKAWDACKRKIRDAMQEVSSEVSGSEEDKRRILNQKVGGPFPTALFHHDMEGQNAYDQSANHGTSIDLEHNPEVGWGDKIELQPQRVDFILTMKPPVGSNLKPLRLQNVRTVPILNRKGWLTSDHTAVTADIPLNE